MNSDEVYFSLSLVEGLGPQKIIKIRKKLAKIEDLFLKSSKDLSIETSEKTSFFDKIKQVFDSKKLEKELSWIKSEGYSLIGFEHLKYPRRLKQIYSPPVFILKQGDLELDPKFALSFVGSRKASYYGKSVTRKIIKEVASAFPETVIVSGLALGIDAEAHVSALDNGLNTIAVLGSGLKNIYPPQNKKLAERILQNKGAVISEQLTFSSPKPSNFPLRNRIISGLSDGIIVVEAGLKSGALITARYALEQNRELFSVPGPIDSMYYEGTNLIIKRNQAKLITSSSDIFEEFEFHQNLQLSFSSQAKSTSDQELKGLSDLEMKILSQLGEESLHLEEISAKLAVPSNELLSGLINLEIKELVIGKVGNYYCKR